MQRSTITWLVLARELPPTIRVDGSAELVAALILDVDTGLVRGVAIDQTGPGALRQATQIALTQPAANLAPGPPNRVLCAIGLSPLVEAELTASGLSSSPQVQEVHPDPEAEDIFDSLLGHLSGRTQPDEPPTPGDWKALIAQTLAFRRTEPWNRWSDDQHLLVTVGGHVPYLAMVMGNAGVQHGLALYPGHGLPASLDKASLHDGPAEATPGSIVLLLDPRDELPPEITAKAHRYGWSDSDPLTPAYMTFGADGPEEISQTHAHVLTVALTAVLAFDRRGLRPADDRAPLTGTVTLADHDTVNYAIHHRPQPTQPEPTLRMHVAGHDLIPAGCAVTLGHLTWDVVTQLTAAAHIHRPAPADAPIPGGREVPLLVLSPDPESDTGPSLAAAIAKLDPYGVGALDTGQGQHAIVLTGANAAEVLMTLPTRHPALLLFQRRLSQTRGRHIILVADAASATGDGTIYGVFDCHQPVTPRPATLGPNKNKKRR